MRVRNGGGRVSRGRRKRAESKSDLHSFTPPKQMSQGMQGPMSSEAVESSGRAYLLEKKRKRSSAASCSPPSRRTSHVVSFLVGKKKRRDRMGLRGLQEGSIVLVVKSEQEKNEAEGWVEETDEKWRSLFAVELEEVLSGSNFLGAMYLPLFYLSDV